MLIHAGGQSFIQRDSLLVMSSKLLLSEQHLAPAVCHKIRWAAAVKKNVDRQQYKLKLRAFTERLSVAMMPLQEGAAWRASFPERLGLLAGTLPTCNCQIKLTGLRLVLQSARSHPLHQHHHQYSRSKSVSVVTTWAAVQQ